MSKKMRGFSLAELLISLLIISIVLSAAIPTITRKAGADREQIWRWSRQGNNAYFGTGSNQSAIIGAESIPKNNESIADMLKDVSANDSTTSRAETGVLNLSDLKYSNFGDKLIILKKTVQSSNSNFMNSHLSFFTMANNEAATTSDIQYAGRLTMDAGNVALGMGTLQNLADSNVGENTAIGHYALLRNDEGFRNTAIGKKALSFNESGSYNTAIGFASLFQLGREDNTETDAFYENTAIGALSQLEKATGRNNTSIGSQSLRKNTTGDNNTVIGQSALINLTEGSGNTIIGTNACKNFTKGSNNICIGYLAGNSAIDENVSKTDPITEDTNGLYIGSGNEAPLISGHTQKIIKGSNTYDKELVFNARKVEFRPFNSSGTSFAFHSYSGTDGYETGENAGRWGIAIFNLRDTGGGDKSSVSMTFGAVGTSATDKEVRIQTYDQYHTSDADRMADISFNNILRLDFPPVVEKNGNSNYSKVGIIGQSVPEAGGTTYKYTLSLNHKFEVENNDAAPLVTITESNGFKIQNDNSLSTTKYFNIKDNQMSLVDNKKILNFSTDYGISLTNDTSSIYLSAENGLSWLNGGNKLISIDAHGIVLTNNMDISLPTLPTSSKYVSGAIKELDERLKTLETIQSDERLKDISGDNIAGLKEINQIEVKNYTYKADKDKIPHVGVIAQQLQKIFPNSVIKGEDGFLRIRTEEIFYAMVNSIKELYTQVQNLTAKITGLDKRINELEKQNKMLIEQNKAFEKRLQKLEQKSK